MYKNQGVFEFVDDAIPVKNPNSKLGVDFEIVPLLVMTDDFDFCTVDKFYGVNLKEMLKEYFVKEIEERLLKHPRSKMVHDLSTTRLSYGEDDTVIFYKMKGGDVDFHLATALGMGVVRMLSGKYAGEYFLYNAMKVDDEFRELNELLMLKIYVQIKYADECDDKGLERLMYEDEDSLRVMVITTESDYEEIYETFERIYASKKGGNNVVQFKRKFVY